MRTEEQLAHLCASFAHRWSAGENPDPEEYVRQAGPRGELLREMLEDVLMVAVPPPPTDETRAVIAALRRGDSSLHGLRLERRLSVDEVVDRVVGDLEIAPGSRERAKALYQRLEAGRLLAGRLAPRLREALARALGLSADALTLVAPTMSAEEALFARGADLDLDLPEVVLADELPGPVDHHLDELFGL